MKKPLRRWRRDHVPRRALLSLAASGVAALLLATSAQAQADKLTVGVLRLASSGPVFLAQELGFFREAVLDV